LKGIYTFGKNMRFSIQIKHYKIVTSNTITQLYTIVELNNIQTTCSKCVHKALYLEKA
jgi:hypothetical protein